MMSKKRTISYCQFELFINGIVQKDVDSFRQMLNLLESKTLTDRIYDFTNSEKVAIIDSITKKENDYVWIVFKTAKYGHTANLINRKDGTERGNTKTIDEGEKQLTHLCLHIEEHNIICAIESNKDGIGASLISKYFENYIKEIDPKITIHASYLSTRGISDIIDKADRIVEADIECSYDDTSDDIFKSLYGDGVKETFMVQFKPEKKRGLNRSKIKKLYNSVDPCGKIRRVRIAIRTNEGNDIVLDSLLETVRDKITVQVDSNGIVASGPLLIQLQDYLQKLKGRI